MIRIFRQYISLRILALVSLDTVLLTASLAVVDSLYFWNNPQALNRLASGSFGAVRLVCFLVSFQACFYFMDLYNPSATRRRFERLIRLGHAVGVASLLLGLVYFVVPHLLIGRTVFFLSAAAASMVVGLCRRAVDRDWHFTPPQTFLILGSGSLARAVGDCLRDRNDLHVRLAGYVLESDLALTYASRDVAERAIGTVRDLTTLVETNRVSRIIVALEDRRGVFPASELVRLKVAGVQIDDAHTALAGLTGRIWLRAVRPSWFVFSDGFSRSKLTLAVKRLCDLTFALTGVLITIPLMALTAIAIRLDSKGPVLYRQTRVGWRGKRFEVLKFRSMRVDAEADGKARWSQAGDPRATRVGNFLRKYRLDELPQFINVLRGEMSFVGPRPERPFFVEQLREGIPYYDERHSVRPGLTGWAQVRYGYGASVEDATRKLEYDLFYLQNLSLLFDCAIVLKTIRIVLSGSGQLADPPAISTLKPVFQPSRKRTEDLGVSGEVLTKREIGA